MVYDFKIVETKIKKNHQIISNGIKVHNDVTLKKIATCISPQVTSIYQNKNLLTILIGAKNPPFITFKSVVL